MDICICFYIFWKMLQWTFWYKSLCGHKFSLLLSIYLVEFLSHMVLIWIFLMSKNVEHLFMGLLVIIILQWTACSFIIGLFVFQLLNCRIFFYIFLIEVPHQIYGVQIFSPILYIVFSLFWGWPLKYKSFYFDDVHFLYFINFAACNFGILFEKP